MRPEVNGFNHLNIRVRDPVKSAEFYKKVFGMDEAFSEMLRAIFLRCGTDLLNPVRTKRGTKV